MKRLISVMLISVALVASIGAVSAGFFDFMTDPSGSIDGKLQDNSAEYNVMTKMAMNDAGDGWSYVECMDWNGTIKINLTNATDQQKEIIKNYTENDVSNFNMSFKYDSDIIKEENEPYDFNISLDGDTLSIEYKADYRVNSTVSPTGTLSVVSGQIKISGDIPMVIDFKK